MFQSSVTVVVGDGQSARFWTNSWLPNGPISRFTPHLFAAIGRRRRQKSVRDAISNQSWVHDIQGATTIEVLCDYAVVWEKVDRVVLHDHTSDRFI
jgi:hypothetical protein